MKTSAIASNQLKTLQDLIAVLESGHYAHFEDEMEEVIVSVEDVAPYLFWDGENYTRNCIAKSDEFELLVICWEKGQSTAIHSHDNQECWVKVIKGSFMEHTYEHNAGEFDLMDSDVVTARQSTSLEDNSLFHSLENNFDGRSISLHLYMKPIYESLYLCEETNTVKTASLDYHSHDGVLL